MRILIADDDLPVARFIAGLFEAEHHRVQITPSCDAPKVIAEEHCDFLLLDADVSGSGGLQLLQTVRAASSCLPVLILTGSDRVDDRVAALNAGADDYLSKPFISSELTARVAALMRRSVLPFEPVLRAEDIELDRVRRIVNRKGREIGLTPKEFCLLEYLMLNAGQNVSRSSIIRNVWKLSADSATNVVDVYINYLRRKLGGDPGQELIHTVRGAGYRIAGKGLSGVH